MNVLGQSFKYLIVVFRFFAENSSTMFKDILLSSLLFFNISRQKQAFTTSNFFLMDDYTEFDFYHN